VKRNRIYEDEHNEASDRLYCDYALFKHFDRLWRTCATDRDAKAGFNWVPAPELPAKAAHIVSKAKAAEKDAVTVSVVLTAVDLHQPRSGHWLVPSPNATRELRHWQL